MGASVIITQFLLHVATFCLAATASAVAWSGTVQFRSGQESFRSVAKVTRKAAAAARKAAGMMPGAAKARQHTPTPSSTAPAPIQSTVPPSQSFPSPPPSAANKSANVLPTPTLHAPPPTAYTPASPKTPPPALPTKSVVSDPVPRAREIKPVTCAQLPPSTPSSSPLSPKCGTASAISCEKMPGSCPEASTTTAEGADLFRQEEEKVGESPSAPIASAHILDTAAQGSFRDNTAENTMADVTCRISGQPRAKGGKKRSKNIRGCRGRGRGKKEDSDPSSVQSQAEPSQPQAGPSKSQAVPSEKTDSPQALSSATQKNARPTNTAKAGPSGSGGGRNGERRPGSAQETAPTAGTTNQSAPRGQFAAIPARQNKRATFNLSQNESVGQPVRKKGKQGRGQASSSGRMGQTSSSNYRRADFHAGPRLAPPGATQHPAAERPPATNTNVPSSADRKNQIAAEFASRGCFAEIRESSKTTPSLLDKAKISARGNATATQHPAAERPPAKNTNVPSFADRKNQIAAEYASRGCFAEIRESSKTTPSLLDKTKISAREEADGKNGKKMRGGKRLVRGFGKGGQKKSSNSALGDSQAGHSQAPRGQ